MMHGHTETAGAYFKKGGICGEGEKDEEVRLGAN